MALVSARQTPDVDMLISRFPGLQAVMYVKGLRVVDDNTLP